MERVSKTMQTAKGDARERAGSVATAACIYRSQGVGGFYRGLAAYVVLCLKPAIQYAVFEQLKRSLLGRRRQAAEAQGAAKTALSAAEAFLLGALARAVSTLVVYPYIRAKVLAQAQTKASSNLEEAGGAAKTPPSISETLGGIVADEGPVGLYRGVQPELARGMLSSAVMLMVKERIHEVSRAVVLAPKRESS
mmetsp:Transcript_65216/g.147083  ORF Transcript_65216/g.147083 Transcript_65216/m.147083 type:complete len:194 (+) Transcript_65216:527-1108(+)